MLVINLTHDDAKKFFLKSTSYFTSKLPDYINFEGMLEKIDKELEKISFKDCKSSNPADFDKVNYCLLTNKDGKNAWRALELIHPLIYVSLVNLITNKENWNLIQNKVFEFKGKYIECCSQPVMSENDQSDTAAQVEKWWKEVEQKSLTYSLNYKYLLQTDVADCYGSLYTHSISWALDGYSESKELKKAKSKNQIKPLGDQIDFYIRSGRYGQTNGISQGSVLMDFIAEIVLSFADSLINDAIECISVDIKILRYRDDYKIFSNSEDDADKVLKIISDKLYFVGMKLNTSKTFFSKNIIESSIKPDKIASTSIPHFRYTKNISLQKHLLKLHAFGSRYPNSGALKRLLSDLHKKIATKNLLSQERSELQVEVQVAIATDIAFLSPSTLPYVVGILSHLIGHSSDTSKKTLVIKILEKMKRVPNNGYLEVWLQRLTAPSNTDYEFESAEKICQIVGRKNIVLWESAWVKNKAILAALNSQNIIIKNASDSPQKIDPKEVALFHYDS